MRRNDAVGTNALHEDCFLIVAGLPLLPIAEPLMCWAFGRALNSGYSVPWRDYGFVIQHNHVDWFETREALRSAAACISNDDASSAGRWALVYLLRATGEKHDAERAETLTDTLTKDRERFEGWRRIETYCATDPCDPASLRPDNIDATAERYRLLQCQFLRAQIFRRS